MAPARTLNIIAYNNLGIWTPWERSREALGRALADLEAAGVAGIVVSRKLASLHNGMQKCY